MDSYYLDSNVFFYAKIMDRKYGDACARILGHVAEGKLIAATSTLAVLETANALRKYGRLRDVADEIGAIYSMGLTVHELLNLDVRSAVEVFQESTVSAYDCAHAAVMRRTGLRVILSADGRHFGWIRGLTVVDPLEYAKGDS